MELDTALHHASTQTYAAPAPVDEYFAPAPAVYAAPAPVAPVLFDFLEPLDRPGRAGFPCKPHRENRRDSDNPVC